MTTSGVKVYEEYRYLLPWYENATYDGTGNLVALMLGGLGELHSTSIEVTAGGHYSLYESDNEPFGGGSLELRDASGALLHQIDLTPQPSDWSPIASLDLPAGRVQVSRMGIQQRVNGAYRQYLLLRDDQPLP